MAVPLCVTNATIAVTTNNTNNPQLPYRNINVITKSQSTRGEIYVNKNRSPDGKLSYGDHLKVVKNLNQALTQLHAQKARAKSKAGRSVHTHNGIYADAEAPEMRYSFQNKARSTDDLRKGTQFADDVSSVGKVVPHTHAQMADFVRKEHSNRAPHTVNVSHGAPKAKTVRGLHVDGQAPKKEKKDFVTTSVTQLFTTTHLTHPLSKPLTGTPLTQGQTSSRSASGLQTSGIAVTGSSSKARLEKRRPKTAITRTRSLPRPSSAHVPATGAGPLSAMPPATGAGPLSAMPPATLIQKTLHVRNFSPVPSSQSSVLTSKTASIANECFNKPETVSHWTEEHERTVNANGPINRNTGHMTSLHNNQNSNDDCDGLVNDATSKFEPHYGRFDDDVTSESDEEITLCSSANHVKIETRTVPEECPKPVVQPHAYVNQTDGLPPLPQLPHVASLLDEDRVYFSVHAHKVLDYYVDQEKQPRTPEIHNVYEDKCRHARCVINRSTSGLSRTKSTAPPPSPTGSTHRLDKVGGHIHTPTPVRLLGSRTNAPPRRPASNIHRTRTPEPAVDHRIYSYVRFHRPLRMVQGAEKSSSQSKLPVAQDSSCRVSRSRSRGVIPSAPVGNRFQVFGTSYTHFNQSQP